MKFNVGDKVEYKDGYTTDGIVVDCPLDHIKDYIKEIKLHGLNGLVGDNPSRSTTAKIKLI